MDTFVTNRIYEELFIAQYKKRYMLTFYILFVVSLAELIMTVVFIWIVDVDPELLVGLYISGGAIIILAVIMYIVAKRADSPNFTHYALDKYKAYQAEQFKHPLFRIVQYGRNQEVIYQVLEINGDLIKVTDQRKRKDSVYMNTYKNITTFKFFVKIKDGVETFKEKIVVLSNGKKLTEFGNKHYNEKLYTYLKTNGFDTIVQ